MLTPDAVATPKIGAKNVYGTLVRKEHHHVDENDSDNEGA